MKLMISLKHLSSLTISVLKSTKNCLQQVNFSDVKLPKNILPLSIIDRQR